MEIKKIIGLLSFLIKIREDKKFYSKNKKELDKYINLIKFEIEVQGKKKKKKFDFKSIKSYIPQIFQLITAYFNSS